MTYIILDRDGVINYDSDSYIKSPAEWTPIPGSLNAIAQLNRAGIHVLVATNQSGIARGLYNATILKRIHEKLQNELQKAGGKIEDFFICPHHPDDLCVCRKPKPGLLYQIQKKYSLHLPNTFFIGDSYTDVQAAKAAGCKPILVCTGNGKNALKQYPELQTLPHFEDLKQAAHYVLSCQP